MMYYYFSYFETYTETMDIKGITWITCGIFLAAGVSLSTIGISLFVKSKSINSAENFESFSLFYIYIYDYLIV